MPFTWYGHLSEMFCDHQSDHCWSVSVLQENWKDIKPLAWVFSKSFGSSISLEFQELQMLVDVLVAARERQVSGLTLLLEWSWETLFLPDWFSKDSFCFIGFVSVWNSWRIVVLVMLEIEGALSFVNCYSPFLVRIILHGIAVNINLVLWRHYWNMITYGKNWTNVIIFNKLV